MQHVHTSEPGADDRRIELASLLQLRMLIRHAFSDVLVFRYLPDARECGAMSARLATYSEGIRSGTAAPQASASSRKVDCQFRVTTSCAQFKNWAPFRKAPARSAPSSTALKKLAASRCATDKFAPLKFVPRRSAPRRSARDRSNPLKSSPRKPARDKSGASSSFARHSFHAAAPRASIATCSSFGIFYPRQGCGELCSAVAVGPIELSLRQAFHALQIDIGQIRAVQLCQ